jgi:hypothetical protein
MPKKGKPWVEQRGDSYLVRQRVDGKKVTIETCDTEEEARWYADSTDIKTHFDLVQRRARQATQGVGSAPG